MDEFSPVHAHIEYIAGKLKSLFNEENLQREPHCLVHGDCRGDNAIFGPTCDDGISKAILIDFQNVAVGNPMIGTLLDVLPTESFAFTDKFKQTWQKL